MADAGTATSARLARHVRRWELEQHESHSNVGEVERWVSLMAGGAMAFYGLSRRGLGGIAIALAGGSLIYRGVTGYCGAYQALGIDTSQSRGPSDSVKAQHGVKV